MINDQDARLIDDHQGEESILLLEAGTFDQRDVDVNRFDHLRESAI